MSFRDLDIKKSYESDVDSLIEDFYIPVLKESVSYDRIAGYFTSSSLAIAARGISSLIENGGSIRLLVSPQFTEQDIDVIQRATDDPDTYIGKCLKNQIGQITSTLEQDYVAGLGWLLANKYLEIRVAIIRNKKGKILTSKEVDERGIFHQKVGILRDPEGNTISFSGSVNETARGWLNNVEEFKVFKDWDSGQAGYCDSDVRKFEDYWSNNRDHVTVFDLPEAVRSSLLEIAAKDGSEIMAIERHRGNTLKNRLSGLSLFDFQLEAVKKWEANNCRLICEMATGTGKTRVACGCIKLALDKEPVAVIIACPQNTLSLQWKKELESVGIIPDKQVVADSTNPKWRSRLEESLLDLTLGLSMNLVVYTTHRTASSEDFQSILTKTKKDTLLFLIGDEVHGLGAREAQRCLSQIYDYRLGLSATPKRWFDDIGTSLLYNFFGPAIFEFGIRNALDTVNPLTGKPYLANFYYHPYFVSLSDSEIGEYIELSKKVSHFAAMKQSDDEYVSAYERLLFARANIHKNAFAKLDAFENILKSIDKKDDLIVFVSPQQIDNTIRILGHYNILSHRFTESEGTTPSNEFGGISEREHLIRCFKEKKLHALVAIKCLDEGIDIPTASKAILLASSSNPREYIQRVGRVIRQHKDKNYATIYDILVKPDYFRLDSVLKQFEKKIFEIEMRRSLDIAKHSVNNAEACNRLFKVMEGLK